MLFIHIVNYIYNNQHNLIQRSVKFFINFVKNTKERLEMLESIKRLLKGVTLVLIMEKEKTTIIELSFYDRQHGIISDYPCINTGIIDENGEEWFTTTFFTWTEFIQEIKAYISYYEAESPQNADCVYIKECDFL